MCNLVNYLDEQIHQCRRQCYAANSDTPAAIEWGQLALIMQRFVGDHAERCATCQKAPKEAASCQL